MKSSSLLRFEESGLRKSEKSRTQRSIQLSNVSIFPALKLFHFINERTLKVSSKWGIISRTNREQPKSAPYLRLKKTRKPLFLQLETTKALKKPKIEKKNSEFFLNFFSKFPVSRIVPKNVKRGRFLSHVRRFGCVENEVLSTYGKSW